MQYSLNRKPGIEIHWVEMRWCRKHTLGKTKQNNNRNGVVLGVKYVNRMERRVPVPANLSHPGTLGVQSPFAKTSKSFSDHIDRVSVKKRFKVH